MLKPLDDIDKAILALLKEGKTAKQIGEEMHISHRTVEGRIARLRYRYNAKNIAQLVAKAALFLALILFASCTSTEKGFRPYVKKPSKDYRGQTENFSGYGTYRPPKRKGVDL